MTTPCGKSHCSCTHGEEVGLLAIDALGIGDDYRIARATHHIAMARCVADPRQHLCNAIQWLQYLLDRENAIRATEPPITAPETETISEPPADWLPVAAETQEPAPIAQPRDEPLPEAVPTSFTITAKDRSAELISSAATLTEAIEVGIRDARAYVLSCLETNKGIDRSIISDLTGTSRADTTKFISSVQDELAAHVAKSKSIDRTTAARTRRATAQANAAAEGAA